MTQVKLATLLAQLTINAATDPVAQSVAMLMEAHFPATHAAARKAPRADHDALDSLVDAHFGVARGAPKWAHDALDWFWELLV